MLGAIIGDIAGSTYEIKEIIERNKKNKVSFEERIKVLDKSVPLFPDLSEVTDDSILTCAIADAYLNKKDYAITLREYGLRELNKGLDKYGRSRFGRGFRTWLENPSENKNYTNGCAMRISALPIFIDNVEKLKEEIYKATITTHNSREALLCVNALSDAIYYAKSGYSKEDIKRRIEAEYFSLNYDIKDLQENYRFTSLALDSVPQAIYIFLISDDFEDGIRKAISIGGDTDTIACITGSILEAFYGVPNNIKEDAYEYIPDYMKDVLEAFYSKKKQLDAKKLVKKI